MRFLQDGISMPAVNDISFTVTRGKTTSIVGESGSGKSVTALSVLKLLPKQCSVNGSILFSLNGNHQADLNNTGNDTIQKIRGNQIAMVFQEPMTSLNPVLTCGYQVMESLKQHQGLSGEEAKRKTISLFEQVELPQPASILNRYPHQLSGGQKQRVMIAMAICCEPALLIADEPTTALDVRVQQNILQLIKKLQVQKNMGMLFITHDLGLVADIADELIVMQKGKIVEQGDAGAILTNPQHPYTKALLACRPVSGSKGKKLAVLEDFNGIKTGIKQSVGSNESQQIENSVQQQPLLKIERLDVSYPVTGSFWSKKGNSMKAVDDVSFSIYKGEIAGLVGESGCGKTTLGRAILQLVKPTSGKIWLNDNELTVLKKQDLRKQRKDMQIVFQDPYGSLNPRITIGNAILESLKVHKLYENNQVRKEVVINMLEKVKLSPDHFNRYPHQFSGGQRQRICIARALISNPSFLVFDESVSALDVSVQAGILNLVNELKNTLSFTALFISHDLSVVHYISDRILVMKQGKIIEAGRANDVYNNPSASYTRQLIEAIPGKTLFSA
mgnify:CR=1 FL=1